MCAITGLYSQEFNDNDSLGRHLTEMTHALSHRGPDSYDTWLHSSLPLGFGHRRLSIQDLSSNGRQPMLSHSGRYIVTYNGEIYNFVEIKDELSNQGISFRGSSDTEILLAYLDVYGLELTLDRIEGMFSFALWDFEKNKLILCRDRIGQKPLYFGWGESSFYFSSELKALKQLPGFRKTLNQNAISDFLKYNYIPTPQTIYQNTFKLPPGSTISFDLESLSNPGTINIEKMVKYYWKLSHSYTHENTKSLNESEVLEHLDSLLTESVRQQTISDVPYGAFLSGGIDSSLITSIMQKNSSIPVNTFTIGFHDKKFNEASLAKKISSHLGTNHHELYLSARDSLDIIPSLATVYDEPFADSSQIPTLLLSQFARTKVTVALSGDGGDELFAGYDRYPMVKNIYDKSRSIPLIAREIFGKFSLILPPVIVEDILNLVSKLSNIEIHNPGTRYLKILNMISSPNMPKCYEFLIQNWQGNKNIIKDYQPNNSILIEYKRNDSIHSDISKVMFLDIVNYLIDDILVKVDRASMHHSLEVRIPLLDRRIVEFSTSIPYSLKRKNNTNKYLLKKLVNNYIPKSLTDTPKSGFSVPLASWLRGDLKEWAGDLFNTIDKYDILDSSIVQNKWKRHLDNKGDFHSELWSVLMMQQWLVENR